MPVKDIKLNQDAQGIYDISFTNGDFTLDSGLETSMMMTCYCQKREETIEDPSSRGGWAGNQLNQNGFEQGSLAWTLFQARADEDSVNLAQNYLEEAFQWYLDQGIAKELIVEVSLDKEKMIASITLTRNDDTQFVQYYDLWFETVRSATPQ
jgi:phage gp46-like protein